MKESGIGRENGVEALEACKWPFHDMLSFPLTPFSVDSQSKSTIINIAPVEETRTVQDWFAEEDDTEKRYG